MTDVEDLEGGVIGGATRVGDSVLRPTGDWTPAVHQLLAHLETVGFDGAPRVIGFEPDRRWRLSALCDAYESVSPPDLLDAAITYLETEARRTSALGGAGREPWASLLRRGSAEALTKRAEWIQTNRAMLAY